MFDQLGVEVFEPQKITLAEIPPSKRTAAQVVRDLGLQQGHAIHCPDGVTREVKRITDNGVIYVKGSRKPIDVHALQKVDQ